MTKAHHSLGRPACRFVMSAIAASCLGAAVVAAPMTTTPKSNIRDGASQPIEKKSSPSALAKGPAFLLRRAASGEDEDCVKVVRMTGTDARIYVTRGLICND